VRAAAVRDEAGGRLSLARDWLPVVGLLVGLLVGMKLLVADPIERRLERMETRINGRIERVEDRINGRLDSIETHLDRMERRLTPEGAQIEEGMTP